MAFKKTVVIPLVLSQPRPGVPLHLYLSVADEVVSLVLVQEANSLSISLVVYSMTLKSATNDRKGGISPHYLGLATQALLLESSSGGQNELPHQVGFAKA